MPSVSTLGVPDADARGGRAGGFESASWAWRALRANARYFFQTPEWAALLAQHLEGDLVWGVLADDGRPVAVSILRRSGRRAAGVELRVLSEVRLGEGYGTPFSDALIDPDALARLTLQDLLAASGPWHVLQLKGLRAGSPWLRLAGSEGHPREDHDGGVGVLDTDVEIEELLRSMPKNMRNAIRKAKSRVQTAGGGEISLATGPELAPAFDRFVALEASGWKGGQGTALAQTPEMCAQLRDYLGASAGAQVRSLHIGGRLAGSQICVTIGDTLFLMRVAYDEQLADLSPGNVLMADLVETCCEDSTVARIDCTVWQTWHQRWGMRREPTYDLLAFNGSSLRGVLAGAAWRARHRLTARRGRPQPVPSQPA